MNFINGVIEEINGTVFFTNEVLNLEIPQGISKNCSNRDISGKSLILGIRPETLHDELIYTDTFPNSKL